MTDGGSGRTAAATAKSKLIENHADEYAQLLGDERERIGLPREVTVFSLKDARARIAELEAQLGNVG